MERKLAGILYADVAGYSRLVSSDEEGTHRIFRAHFDALSAMIRGHGGRVVHTAGDAVLAEFASVVTALKCAVAIQRDMAERNSELADDRKVQFRIGVNLGDVIIDGEEIYGNGVNIAARLETLAEPGGICASGRVLEQVEKNVAVGFACLGLQTVKNIEKPVRAYKVLLNPADTSEVIGANKPQATPRWRWVAAVGTLALVLTAGAAAIWLHLSKPGEELASVARMAFPLPDKPSIAVLPFTNLSDDSRQDYFADGMTDDLITDLSKVSGLFVIARNSSFSYKGQQVNVRKVAEDLGVRYVLEGSVRRAGDTVRINAQLIDATTGGHLWAERYDGSLDDVFALQDRLTEQIVTALAVQLTPGEQQNQTETETNITEAYDAFLRGWTHYRRSTRDDYTKARDYFERAIELDPDYSKAYAALAATYWESFRREMFTAMQLDRHSTRRRAENYLEKALLDPTPLALQVSAKMLVWRGKHEQAVAEARKAVALSPNDAEGHVTLAAMLTWNGKPREALESIARARRLDPLNEANHAYFEGLARIGLGQYQEAAVSLERALDLNPSFLMAGVPLAVAYLYLDRLPEARAAVKPYCEDVWCQNAATEAYWFPFKRDEDRKRFIDGLIGAGLAE